MFVSAIGPVAPVRRGAFASPTPTADRELVDPAVLPTDELAARFSGKRAAERFDCRVAVVLHSGNRQFPGEAINISRTGVLVRMRYASLSGSVSRMRVGSAMDAADRHFGTQFRLEIPGTKV